MSQEPKTLSHGASAQSVLSLVGLLIVFLIGLIMKIVELIIFLKDYNPVQGLVSSPWVGFANLNILIQSPVFIHILRNTLFFNLFFAAILFLLISLVGYILTFMPKGLKSVTTLFFGLLVFLPSEVFAAWIIHFFGSPVLVNATVMRYLFPFLCSIKFMGIPLALIYLRNEIYVEKDALAPVKIGGLAAMVSMAFLSFGFYSLNMSLQNPLTYETMDMLDTYLYRTGFMMMNFGSSATVGLISFFITIISVVIFGGPAWLLIKHSFRGERKKSSADWTARLLISPAIALALFAVLYFLPYMNKGYTFDINPLGPALTLPGSIVSSLMVSAIAAMVSTMLAYLLSGAFVSKSKGIAITATLFLVAITILNMAPISVSSYLFVRRMGMLNTRYAIILTTCFSSAAVWAMVCMRRNRLHSDQTLLQDLLALFLIQTALIYGNITPQLVYYTNMQSSSLLMLRQFYIGPQPVQNADGASILGAVGLYGFLVALPSMLMFLAVFSFLPKDKMLTIISAGVKN